jgi:hypothetical protein
MTGEPEFDVLLAKACTVFISGQPNPYSQKRYIVHFSPTFQESKCSRPKNHIQKSQQSRGNLCFLAPELGEDMTLAVEDQESD